MGADHDLERAGPTPALTVVIPTHDRLDGVVRAVKSVLAQQHGHLLEVVVVDDGSSPEIAAAMDVALNERGVTVVHQERHGPAAARARGADQSRGEWLTFLDDDDVWLPEWTELMLPLMRDPQTAFVSGAAALHQVGSGERSVLPPKPLGPVFSDVSAQYLAGCFAVRRDLYVAAGGYLRGLAFSEQTELMIRLAACLRGRGLRSAQVGDPVAVVHRRQPGARALARPRPIYDSARWVLARHAEHFALDRHERSNWLGVAAMNGMHLGERRARSLAVRSAIDRPGSLRAWLRVAVVLMSAVRRRWWPSRRPQSRGSAAGRPLAQAVMLLAQGGDPVDRYFLPWGYRESPQTPAEAHGYPSWGGRVDRDDVAARVPIYRWAARLLRSEGLSVLDIGCGSGRHLVQIVAPEAPGPIGVDETTVIEIARREFPHEAWIAADLTQAGEWSELPPSDLVISAGGMEHLADPYEFLLRLRSVVAPGGHLLISMSDRSRLGDAARFGPPRHAHRLREWDRGEFELLLESAGFDVVRSRHLRPRAYSPNVLRAKRLPVRHLRRRPVSDLRSSVAFLVRPSDH